MDAIPLPIHTHFADTNPIPSGLPNRERQWFQSMSSSRRGSGNDQPQRRRRSSAFLAPGLEVFPGEAEAGPSGRPSTHHSTSSSRHSIAHILRTPSPVSETPGESQDTKRRRSRLEEELQADPHERSVSSDDDQSWGSDNTDSSEW